MFKKHNFKIFRQNPSDPNFDLLELLGEVNLYVSKLHEENSINGVISKITDDFKKIVAEAKLKELYQKHFTKLQKRKNTQSKIKPLKVGKQSRTTYCFACKDYTKNFRPEKVTMINKVLREKPLSI